MIQIKIDNREKKLIDLLDIPFSSEQLDIGDIQIWSSEEDPLVLIERKTIDDLAQSIVDGRYREQKKRILGSSFKKIIYLIEGNIAEYSGSLPKTTLKNTLINCTVRDNIYILESRDLEESSYIIKTMYEKLNSGSYMVGAGCQITHSQTLVHQSKARNNTPEQCYINQLAQIPGISGKVASEIAKEFPKILDLLRKLEEDPKYFKTFKVGGRKLGIRGERIYEYLI
jgi:ERCC4-type nuclease